jgi:hypothetical protein
VRVAFRGDQAPLWWLVSHVASGHLDPAPVLAAFRALSAPVRLAAWKEIAEGDAYDLHEAHSTTFKDAGIARTPATVKYWTNLFSWLADACGALPDPVGMAEALLRDLPDDGAAPRLFTGLLALHRQKALAPRHDALVRALAERGDHDLVFAAPVTKEILRGLPKDRSAILAPLFARN